MATRTTKKRSKRKKKRPSKPLYHMTVDFVEAFPSRSVIDKMLGQSGKRCYCNGCGQFFTSESAFELHLEGYDPVTCRPPDNISPKIKLVDRRLVGMPRPLWGQPGESPLRIGKPTVFYESLPGESA